MTIAVLLIGLVFVIFYARARAVVRAELDDSDDDRLREYVYVEEGGADDRAHLRRKLRARGFSRRQIEAWMQNDRKRERLRHLRLVHGRDPFPSRDLTASKRGRGASRG